MFGLSGHAVAAVYPPLLGALESGVERLSGLVVVVINLACLHEVGRVGERGYAVAHFADNLLRDRLANLQNKRVMTALTAQFDNRRLELDRMRDRLTSAEERGLARCRERFVGLTASLDAMSPLRVLTRGYTIAAAEDGSCVKSAAELTVGQRLRLSFSDGSADCLVEDVQRS